MLATAGTLTIMGARFGAEAATRTQAAAYGESVRIGEVSVRLAPAGHVLGSAQVVLEHGGSRVVISGDYKRRPDPTCAPFEPVRCDVFVTEATFGLPVFRHPPDDGEIDRLLNSLRLFPERCHVVGVYALGKCQRVIAILRRAGYGAPIYLHGALQEPCDLYRAQGIELRRPPAGDDGRGAASWPTDRAGAALGHGRSLGAAAARSGGRHGQRLDARARRARQRGVELPLVISDHADWDELTRTFDDVGAPEIWVTHGREEALIHYATGKASAPARCRSSAARRKANETRGGHGRADPPRHRSGYR